MNHERGVNANGRVRVLVVFGGQSGEHDVSLRSAQTVIASLDPTRFDVVQAGITRDGHWLTGGNPMAVLASQSPLFTLPDGTQVVDEGDVVESNASEALPAVVSGQIDVVFPVLHGPMGEDGTIQGMLEMSGAAYVGSGVLGSALAMDKGAAKMMLAQAGIPQGKWITVSRRDWERIPDDVRRRIDEEFGYPCFTKPANMGSSVGITKVHDQAELDQAMDEASRFDRRIVVEQGIDARELEVSVLGNEDLETSVIGEIVPSREFYDYQAKYVDDDSALIIPAEIEEAIARDVRSTAIRVFQALDLAGMARVDFFLERGTNRLLVNEVNTIPGFTSISMYPLLWEASGLPLPRLIERLVELAIERRNEKRA